MLTWTGADTLHQEALACHAWKSSTMSKLRLHRIERSWCSATLLSHDLSPVPIREAGNGFGSSKPESLDWLSHARAQYITVCLPWKYVYIYKYIYIYRAVRVYIYICVCMCSEPVVNRLTASFCLSKRFLKRKYSMHDIIRSNAFRCNLMLGWQATLVLPHWAPSFVCFQHKLWP